MPRWMEQQARNATMEEWGFLRGCRYLLHDRDTKFCASFRELIESGSIKTIRLPARSPNLNSFAERWVRSVKEECLSRLILFGESSLRRALQNVVPVVRHPGSSLSVLMAQTIRRIEASQILGSSPRVDEETERLVRMAKENPGWGYDRIVGAMANLGLRLSDQTAGNILRRHDIPPAPKRKQTSSWKDFIRAHMAVLVATDFFTVEVLTLRGLITYYVLFFIDLESRRVCLAGVTRHPEQEWMEQMARNVTMEDSGFLINRRYLLHDRDSKYCSSFGQVIEAGSVKTLALPPRSPNLNAYAERCFRALLFQFDENHFQQIVAQVLGQMFLGGHEHTLARFPTAFLRSPVREGEPPVVACEKHCNDGRVAVHDRLFVWTVPPRGSRARDRFPRPPCNASSRREPDQPRLVAVSGP